MAQEQPRCWKSCASQTRGAQHGGESCGGQRERRAPGGRGLAGEAGFDARVPRDVG